MKRLNRECAAMLLDAVPATMRVIRQHMRRHRLSGISVPQMRVLLFLDRRGPATLSSVAEYVGTTLPSMSRMVQSLVQGQWVRRSAGSPDRRTVRLELAPRGRRVLERARKATVEQLSLQLGALRPGQVNRLKEAMVLLLQVMAASDGVPRPREGRSRC